MVRLPRLTEFNKRITKMAAKAHKIDTVSAESEVVDINTKRNLIAVASEDTAKSETRRLTRDESRSIAFERMGELGRAIADGSQSMTDAAIDFNRLCRDGNATTGKSGDDAERLYLALANAINARMSERNRVDFVAADVKSAKSAITLFRSFGKAEVVAQGSSWFERVLSIKADLGEKCKLSGYNAMAKANRAVVEESRKMVGNRAYLADDADIMEWIAAKPPVAKDAAAALQEVLDKMIDASKDHEYSYGPELIEVMQRFADHAQSFIDGWDRV